MDPVGKRLLLTISGVVLMLLAYSAVADRLPPWQDELFVVSTGLSIARSKPPIESVMALYPQSDSPIKFYGPVSFESEALLIHIFGLSMRAWRLVCFAGVVFNLLVAVNLVRLGGGDEWAQLVTALTLGISGFTAAMQPGRWDFVTSGLFFSGLLILLPALEAGARALLWRAATAGLLIGCSLGSTPRALTLSLAAAVAACLLMLFFPRTRRNLLLGSLAAGSSAVLAQTLLLLPWGLDSFSWYAYVRRATRQDIHNATPLTGAGGWGLDIHHHKTLTLVAVCLLLASICNVASRWSSAYSNGKLPIRAFLALFAVSNLTLMLLLTRGSLGLSSFWLTPAIVAVMSWFCGRSLFLTRTGTAGAAFVGLAMLILLFQAARQVVAISLTWSRRNDAEVAAIVRRNIPEGAVVYGPINGYLYAVENAKRTYLYLYEQQRQVIPWLPANPHLDAAVPVSRDLDNQICAQPAYVMWPVPDLVRQPLEEPMPETLRARLGLKIAQLHRPPLPKWKEALLGKMGQIGGKYGFPDVAIFQLRGRGRCGEP
jgi:hypothetical protein